MVGVGDCLCGVGLFWFVIRERLERLGRLRIDGVLDLGFLLALERIRSWSSAGEHARLRDVIPPPELMERLRPQTTLHI